MRAVGRNAYVKTPLSNLLSLMLEIVLWEGLISFYHFSENWWTLLSLFMEM